MERVTLAVGDLGIHVIVRLIPDGERYYPGGPVSLSDLNGLISSKKPHELAVAVAKLPPLLPPGVRLDMERRGREFSLEEVLGDSRLLRLSEPVPELLQHESIFNANIHLEDKLASARTAVKKVGYSSEWLRNGFGSCELGKARIVVEPLSEWVLVRNILGLTARLIALIGECDDPLVRAGFIKRQNKYLGEDIWTMPFAFNPFFATINSLEGFRARFGDYGVYNPLFKMLTHVDVEKPKGAGVVKRQLEKVHANCFGPAKYGDSDAVYLLTKPVASEEYIGLFGGKQKEKERSYFLCTKADRGQGDVARRIVNALVDAVADYHGPLNTGEIVQLGWEENADARFSSSPAPAIKTLSTLSDLMYRIVYRGEERISVCSNCGCAILQSQKGPLKEWCSPACRMASIRRAERQREDGVKGE